MRMSRKTQAGTSEKGGKKMKRNSNRGDTIDQFFCENQLVGGIFKRTYSFFKTHTAVTDAIHVSLGLGIGLIFGSERMMAPGLFFLSLGLLGHIFAFIKG